ncbi:S41 family peptidase [Labilibaculum sp. DW002]|jgi:carboxyl-terminal processing protease|uniref:S41 family peptidase n=1 Tax=Paralabilibaculum antarcticum TaxID=2912572 RepID=A0ABT5VZX8_9BACT|nr:S41 family peptidase [Labilibaculum sp. DW002]MDE5420387.1 S41 family peptidase [Labilibaculum sp. DW002]
MKNSFSKLLLLITVILTSLAYTSCNKDDSDHKKNEFDVINEVMEAWYFWNDELPDINSSNYNSVNNYFEELLVSKDRWSYIANRDQLLAYLENGTYIGYGLGFKYDSNNDLRVKLIFDESPLAAEGIARGWKLININGKDVSSLSDNQVLDELDKSSAQFVFENNIGEQKDFLASQITLDQNSVLKREVIDYQGIKVAYLAFDSFLTKSEEELNEAFTYFKEQSAEELVLDLRYNGGGSTAISNQLSSLITGNAFTNDIYSKVFHNESKMSEDFTEAFQEQAAAYAFDRVFIITTSGTASASEMVINGLKPYLDDVILIGSTTHGKPVGMYVFEDISLNLAIVPISFKITNAADEGDYFEGIPVDLEISDDLSYDFGDIEESNFKAALDYIVSGNFPVITAAKALSTNEREFKKKGFDELVGAN